MHTALSAGPCECGFPNVSAFTSVKRHFMSSPLEHTQNQNLDFCFSDLIFPLPSFVPFEWYRGQVDKHRVGDCTLLQTSWPLLWMACSTPESNNDKILYLAIPQILYLLFHKNDRILNFKKKKGQNHLRGNNGSIIFISTVIHLCHLKWPMTLMYFWQHFLQETSESKLMTSHLCVARASKDHDTRPIMLRP